MNVIDSFNTYLQNHIKHTFSLDDYTVSGCEITLNTDPCKQQFGDITTNASMILARTLKKAPFAIAQDIIAEFNHPDIKHAEIAGAGFINFFLTEHAIQKISQEIFTQKASFFKSITPDNAHSYNIEFVSANPTGPLYVSHGRGGIIGDVLGNILSFIGHNVTKEYYINDAGSQITKLGHSLKVRCLQAQGLSVEMPEDGYRGSYLVSLSRLFIDEHPDQDLENLDISVYAQYAQKHVLTSIKETLSSYGINFDVWFSEKKLHTQGRIEQALQILDKQGYLYNKDDALWFASTYFGDDKDRVLKRANGQLTYAAADIAYLEDKVERSFDKIIIILGQDHHGYTQRLKGAIQALGHPKDMLDTILYQLVTLKEGNTVVRMSKRAGHGVELKDIIETVGKDVARYFYLNKKADAHLELDLDLAVKKSQENPVYYIQYAYVRTKSIIAKSHTCVDFHDITYHDLDHVTCDESLIIKKIVSLKTALMNIACNYQTHILSYYTYELSQMFHKYYGSHKVCDETDIKRTRARLAVVMLVKQTLEYCFDMLSIDKPDKM
jgi:arginyl-tRNA synthetase